MVDSSEQSKENRIIYLDNAATTFPKPLDVINKANEFYANYGGNAGRGGNPLSRSSSRLLAETREMVADWFNVPYPERVIFSASSTHALNEAILGTALKSNDIIYVTPFEHNSVLRPVEHLRQTKGVQVRQIPFARRTFTCQIDNLAAMFQAEPPDMVCVTQTSNVCGVILPVREIASLAKKTNPQAVVIVDGTQVGGLYPLELSDGLIDAFIFSGHKSLYGPYGVAGLIIASAWRPMPLLFGGTGTFSESVEMPIDLPSAYEAGSHNIWAIAGLHAAVQWLEQTGREKINNHSLSLAKHLCTRLATFPSVTVHVPHGLVPWCGIVSFTIEDTSPQAIETALGARGIAVRAGLHCSPWTHRWLGTIQTGGSIRVSPGYFNTLLDIEELIKETAPIAVSVF